jgi:hypothetical protein
LATLKKYLILFVLGVAIFIPSLSGADIIDTGSVWVTDVTPVQFSVVWGTSEPATGSVSVFADADGNVPVADAVVHFESADHPPAEDIGVMKVRVTNLQPNTQYFFQISSTAKNNGAVSLYPDAPPYLEVTTELGSVIVRNDVLVQQISIEGGKSTQGTLVIAEIDLASYPVTAESGGIQQVSVKASLPSSGGGSVSSTSSSGASGGGSCFIGTAAFGSNMEYQSLSLLLITSFLIIIVHFYTLYCRAKDRKQ